MRAEALRGEERPFEMDAEDARAAVRPERKLPKRLVQLLLGCRDERRQVARDPGLEQRFARAAVALRGGVEEIDSAEAVHLDVDESRGRDAVAVSTREPVAADLAVHDLDVAGDEEPLRQRGSDAEPHRAAASLTLPFA